MRDDGRSLSNGHGASFSNGPGGPRVLQAPEVQETRVTFWSLI